MRIKTILRTILKALLILATFVCVIVIARTRTTNRVFVNVYANFDVEYADDTTHHSETKNFGRVDKGDRVTAHLCLPQEPIMDDAVLTFYIYHSVTEVWCDGVLLDSYGADIDARGDMVGSNYFTIPVPDAAWGGEITIKLRATENNAFTRIKNMGLYPAVKAYEYFIDMDVVSFILGLPLLLLGLIAFAVFLLSGALSGGDRKVLYIAAFAVLASTWLLTKTGVQLLFGLGQYIWTQLEFVAVFTMVIPILLWAYDTETNLLMRKLLGGAALLNTGFFAVSTVLHVTNVAHYCATLLLSNILTFISGVLLVIFAVKRLKRGGSSDKLFFCGMMIMFAAGMMDLMRTNLNRFFPGLIKVTLPSVLAMGMLFFIIFLLRSYLEETKERQKKFITAQVEAENLNRILDTTPTGICQLDPRDELSIVAANDIFYNIIGYRDLAVIHNKPKEFFAFLYDDEKTFIYQKLSEVLASDATTGEFEFSTTDIEGNPFTLMVRYCYDREGSGNITVNIIDITDRKRMEEEVALSEKRYRLALTQSGKVFFFFDVPTRTMRLSDELAEVFGLPNEVDNMPENFIAKGLVEADSEENYRDLYRRIIAGEPSGETVIACHMRQAPETVLWYKIAFTSIFDAQGRPQSAIITYDDLQEQRAKEIASAWKQLNLLSVPESQYVIAEYDLTKNRLLSQVGGLFAKLPEFVTSYDDINDFVLAHFIQDEDVPDYRRFLDRTRLLEMFENGQNADYMEYRSLQSGSASRWTSTSIQMIRDPYSGNVLAQLLFRDIHVEKSGQIEMLQDIEELRTELENSRIKVMINQMQPHFLYNALSAIQTIVKSDPDYAYQLIYDFTVHLRSSIKALQSDEPIPFRDELKNIRAYLNIEQMRFGDSLKVNYEIDCEDFCVIPLSIQPLAENAARHGVYPKGEEGGTVTVRTYETVSAYVVVVEDDGLGFHASEVLNSKSNSVGLKNLIFRLKSLMNADVVIDSIIGVGTRVTVTIPKKES